MDNLKLTIDLLPRGAWGNNLREVLIKDEWDTLRNFCYERFNHRCAICGKDDTDLDAHEVWEFDEQNKTQTLNDIIALCPACHGVKHMRNSIRIGYGEQSKSHFMKVNKCDQMTFAAHYADATFKFEELNSVLRWTLVADLEKFGGKDIEIKLRNIPLIENHYDGVDWVTVNHVIVDDGQFPTELFLKTDKGIKRTAFLLTYEEMREQGPFKDVSISAPRYFTVEKVRTANNEPTLSCPLPPKICSIDVNNYDGTLTVSSDYSNKIQWITGGKIIKTKYNINGRFTTKFSVENLECKDLQFKLIGDGGETMSQTFVLKKAT